MALAKLTAPKWWPRFKAVCGRLTVAHLLAYPIAGAWVAGVMPLVILSMKDLVLAKGEAAEVIDLIVRRASVPALVAFAIMHLAALPWALAKPEREARATRVFKYVGGGLAAIAVVGGGASWAWLIFAEH